MKKKQLASTLLALAFVTPALLSLSGCASDQTVTLRVYNWEEYIDEGGEGSYEYDYEINEDGSAPSMIDDFETWYEEEYHKKVNVEYSTFGTNEDLYNQLKLGDKYDLVCPSEYMIMKLAAEGMIQPLCFNENDEHNYYLSNLSPFIREKFDAGKMQVMGEAEPQSWSKYAAGYMWGVTGLVYNPEQVKEQDLSKGWSLILDPAYKNKVTTKDNVRDSYFVGLGILYRKELLDLKAKNESGELSDAEYAVAVTEIMNRTDEESVDGARDVLMKMKENIFGFETDTGKSDMVKGTISLNFAWSGDAVYAMDQAEEEGVSLGFSIPEECANLFFDGWVMPKDDKRDQDTEQAALAFINYLSRPDNAVRNSYYIGYTSVIAGRKMFEYVSDTYSAEDETNAVPYDVSYFFGQDAVIFADEEQLSRQLYAQYPPAEAVKRCAVMNYYGEKEEAINELWTQVKGERLDAWAIVVLIVAAVLVVLFILFAKFGNKIEFRTKPKKGYVLKEQKPLP